MSDTHLEFFIFPISFSGLSTKKQFSTSSEPSSWTRTTYRPGPWWATSSWSSRTQTPLSTATEKQSVSFLIIYFITLNCLHIFFYFVKIKSFFRNFPRSKTLLSFWLMQNRYKHVTIMSKKIHLKLKNNSTDNFIKLILRKLPYFT